MLALAAPCDTHAPRSAFRAIGANGAGPGPAMVFQPSADHHYWPWQRFTAEESVYWGKQCHEKQNSRRALPPLDTDELESSAFRPIAPAPAAEPPMQPAMEHDSEHWTPEPVYVPTSPAYEYPPYVPTSPAYMPEVTTPIRQLLAVPEVQQTMASASRKRAADSVQQGQDKRPRDGSPEPEMLRARSVSTAIAERFNAAEARGDVIVIQ